MKKAAVKTLISSLRRDRSEDCPTDDFQEGIPAGKCEGDGHYRCLSCRWMLAKEIKGK